MKSVMWFDHFVSPLGALLLGSDGEALTGVWFDGQRYQPSMGAEWQRRSDLAALNSAARELAEYFAGERTAFGLTLAPSGTPFQRAVWNTIASVPYGETIAYRDLAERVGQPRAIRAAGAATGRNPWSIIIPCHRIVGADGSLTGYAGGLERKRALLALERTKLAAAPIRRAA